MALLVGSLFATLFTLYASQLGFRIVRGWDLNSGDERQLDFERKTYLISSILNYVMLYELLSLLLFIYTADYLHSSFVGAMCAAGTLNVNDFGYPTLTLKIINAVLCGVWIILNFTDNLAWDYPLIKFKYRWTMAIAVFVLMEALFQVQYFSELHPDVITSCCGTLFSGENRSVATAITHLPSYIMKVVFYLSVLLMIRMGIHIVWTGKGAKGFALLSLYWFIISIVSIISFVSPHFYELPTHHCPFCILQREYHHVGYPLYLSLLGAAIMGMGLGVIDRFKSIPSLHILVPVVQRRLVILSLLGCLIFAAVASAPLVFSDFKLEGY
jgi:hypothetical protein